MDDFLIFPFHFYLFDDFLSIGTTEWTRNDSRSDQQIKNHCEKEPYIREPHTESKVEIGKIKDKSNFTEFLSS